MQTAVIGYPRIGTLRELKFASEQYFRKEIEAGELLQTAKELRKTHWLTQKEYQGTIETEYKKKIFFKAQNDARNYDISRFFMCMVCSVSFVCFGNV